ncbi:hypothetical protein [Methylophaga thalassica]|uniref:hypothetical protein n=1 Tax=Methylophaga thalassica TaxID=40223 RepID=UPI002E7AD794|nr:hypothetical protein [Methylophaga thalassica]WVI85665.1 hypothetical protein VSX76_03385 [Methylophaga thalassica]
MTTSPAKISWLFLALAALFILTVPQAEAGLISGLAKLGKKVDAPDTHHASSFRFADELAHYPEGSVAEISFNHSQNQWMARTPDGKNVPVHQFTENAVDANKQATLLLSESNLPYSLDAFNKLPAEVAIKLKSRHGKTYSLSTSPAATKLIDNHISINISDMSSLKTALWQLQRPVTSANMRLIQLADNPDLTLPKQSYGSKIPVNKVGTNQLLNALKTMRQQSFVISAKVEDGFIIQGKEKIAVTDLEKVAADRDIILIILGSDKPKKTLDQLAKDWQKRKDTGSLNSYTAGDFYNAFAPKNSSSPVPVEIDSSGKLRTALHFDHSVPTKAIQTQSSSIELALLPLHVLTKSVMLFQPNEARAKELDDRIHPAIPSWVHLSLIASLVIGLVAYKTSWFLYLKLWASPLRVNYRHWFPFTLRYLLHRVSFVLFYLPLLGFISPLYILITWTYRIIHFLLIRPAYWIFNKFG